ncbi:hypothetical protein TNCV_4447751 [Trichonephila clavipes]|nr:hypothetical protein TNCV_4447751 [Trichonephila clavipes]
MKSQSHASRIPSTQPITILPLSRMQHSIFTMPNIAGFQTWDCGLLYSPTPDANKALVSRRSCKPSRCRGNARPLIEFKHSSRVVIECDVHEQSLPVLPSSCKSSRELGGRGIEAPDPPGITPQNWRGMVIPCSPTIRMLNAILYGAESCG